MFVLIFFVLALINSQPEKASEQPKNLTQQDIEAPKSFNITIDEMDKLMMCSMFISYAFDKDKDRVFQLSQKLNSTYSETSEKIAYDLIDICLEKITMKQVNKAFNNLTFNKNFKWEKELDPFIAIDYDKYKDKKSLIPTASQQVMNYKLQKVREIFQQKQDEERRKLEEENMRFRIGEYDLEKLPKSFKLILLIVVFGGVFYFVISYIIKFVEKKNSYGKKDKKKKKTQ